MSVAIYLVVAALFLAGCVSLTPEAERVRVVRNPNDVRDCARLGELESSSTWVNLAADQGYENNKRTMRNDAAQLGGDTLLILEERAGLLTRSRGEAYRCSPGGGQR